MGREFVSDEMGGVTNGKVLAFGGVEVQLPISGADVYANIHSSRNGVADLLRSRYGSHKFRSN